jgi:NAD(P)-dependent dehydrogenase (short-subunit alcohol dehydrogenase family)
MDLGLSAATAVVTGGTQGMGRSVAEFLARDGARVAVFARSPDALEETAESLRRLGSPDAVGIRVDVSDTASVEAGFAQVGDRWSSLNALVNTVGPSITGTIDELSDDQWRENFEVGTMSAVRCVRAALPLLRKAEWARIVIVSAHSTKRQTPTLISYTAAKSALTSISKNLSRTLAPEGILVNTVSPGTYLTGGVRRWLEGMAAERGIDPTSLEDLNRIIAEDFGEPSDLGRAGLPDEIGAVIAFLASRRNSYMTGADVNVDGGSDFT